MIYSLYLYASPFSFHFRCSNASKFSVNIDPEGISVADFKERIAEEADVPAPNQRLIYRGRVLKDEHQLSFYGTYYYYFTVNEVRPSAPRFMHHSTRILT